MKKTGKLSFIILLVLIGSFISMNIVLAHPGRTDKRGGHYCWTNCKKWGLKYGQYHFHKR